MKAPFLQSLYWTRNFLYSCKTRVTSSYRFKGISTQTELFEKHTLKKLEAILRMIFTVTLYLSPSRTHVSNMKRATKLIPYETRVTRLYPLWFQASVRLATISAMLCFWKSEWQQRSNVTNLVHIINIQNDRNVTAASMACVAAAQWSVPRAT